MPYTSVQFVTISEFKGIGTKVGQGMAAALVGQQSITDTLKEEQQATERTMKRAGYTN